MTEYWVTVLQEATEDQWAVRRQEFLDEAQYQQLVKFLGKITLKTETIWQLK